MAQQFNYAVYQERLSRLEAKTRALLKETNNMELTCKMDSELAGLQDRKELRLAFVGQYSSGKSTIISALTGRKDIKIDANVATDRVSEYKWNNIILMDTPGILAGKVESHDESTKVALKECDLIFYVLTSQLFDDVLFNNFIDLAYNQHFADKMLIVVNKMGMESGEFDQLVDNYTISLEKIFSERGYELKNFPLAFIDAADYMDGIDENDNEFVQLSNFEHFIDMLNVFVARKGMIKKQFDTPVRVYQSYLKNIAVTAVDQTLSDFYNQFEQKLRHSLSDLKRDTNNDLSSFASMAMGKIICLSNDIGGIDENEWKCKQEALNSELQNIISNTSAKIEDTINSNYERLMTDVNDFCGKDSLVKYSGDIDRKLASPDISIEEHKNLSMQKKALDLLKQGGVQIGNMAPNVTTLAGGIGQASGSTLHKMVLDVGHFFGKSFGPWQAVRWASNIAKVAKFGIPVVSAGIEIWMQFREDSKENKRLEQIKSAKNQFVSTYQVEINKVAEQFEKYLLQVFGNYTNKLKEINHSKTELIEASNKNDITIKKISELDAEYADFIEAIEVDE